MWDSELSSVETRTHPERQYLDLLADVIKNGERRLDRTGVGTLGVFGRQMRFDLTVGFPLFTTKYVHFPAIKQELAWFLSGSTNIGSLRGGGCRIWNEWADSEGDLGPVYGKQWRSWTAPNGENIDQINGVISSIRNDPYSRRHIVSAWNPADIEAMALPPCHCLFQFYVSGDTLSCHLYQRSADLFLGVPFNVASYALLTHLIARETGLQVGEFIHTLGDAHLYLNHIENAEKQIARKPYEFPKLRLPKEIDLRQLDPSSIKTKGYQHYEAIPADIAV